MHGISKWALRRSGFVGTLFVAFVAACSDAKSETPSADPRGATVDDDRGAERNSDSADQPSSASGAGCKGANGKLLPSGDVLYRIPGAIADLDRVGSNLYYVGLPSLIGGPGKGGVYRAPEAGGGSFEQVISEDYAVLHLTVLGDSLYADTATDELFQFSLDGDQQKDLSAAGNRAFSDGEAVYAWGEDLSSCDDSEKFGINRVAASGQVTSIDAQAHCIKDVTVGGDSVYWLEGDVFANLTGGVTPITLYRAPKAGGGAREKLPLDVGSWTSLEWTDGYLIGTSENTGSFTRGRPEDAKPAFIAHDVSDLTTDGAGTAFFSDLSETDSCLVHAKGGGDLVRYGGYDSDTSLVGRIVAYPDAVYYTADAEEDSNGLNRVTVVRRLEL